MLDMDETLCSFVSPVIAECRKLWPERVFKLPRYGRYSKWFQDNFPRPEDMELVKKHVLNDDFYLNLPPIFGSHDDDTIESLSAMCWNNFDRISIVTHRKGCMKFPEQVTREYLHRHGFIDAHKVVLSVLDGSSSKVHALSPSRKTLIVDDSVSVATDVTKNSTHHMLLVSHPWNMGFPRSANCTQTPVRKLVDQIKALSSELVNEKCEQGTS